MHAIRLALTLLLVALPALASAEIWLPQVFGDHMVLQREIAVPVWGTANPGEAITITFAGQTQTTQAAADGAWSVPLAPLAANAEPQTLTIATPDGRKEFTDVLVGDVWLASGQSNMDSPLGSMKTAVAVLEQANDPGLRFFKVTKGTAAEPQKDLKGQWQPATPETARNFSAVAYLYAKEIRRTQNVPVAVLQSSWGGTPVKAWMSMESLQQAPKLENPLKEWDAAVTAHQKVVANPQLAAEYEAGLKRFLKEVYPAHSAATKAYNAAVAAGTASGPKPEPASPEPVNPDPMGMPGPSKRPQTPTIIFNANIRPLAPYAIRGVIWYQGEADGGNGIAYRELFPRLISGWRALWGQGDFPFLFVQLPANQKDETPVATSGWPFLREAQLFTMQRTPNTGMAITLDIGDPKDPHPQNKEFAAARLALVGRKVAYGEQIVASGPLYAGHEISGSKVRLRFSETGGGLTIGQAPWVADGNTQLPADKLVGFYVAGSDGKWFEAKAAIEGDSVIVSSPEVSAPAAVRYGWANSPRANLYNREGLAASPFRTDDWAR